MTKKMRAWGTLMLWVPLVLVAACSTEEKVKPAPVQKVVQSPGKAVVTVNEFSDGASVVLDANQELRVELPDSAYSVNSNMDWSVADLKPGVLDVLGSKFERAGEGYMMDAAGTTIWRLKPLAAGRVTLKFELRKLRSLEPPKRTLTYDVTVK
jgi:hypothetical protein